MHRIRCFVIDPTRLFVVFSIAKSEFVDQLLELFDVLDHRNTGARVMCLVLPADFVGQLFKALVFADGRRRIRFREIINL